MKCFSVIWRMLREPHRRLYHPGAEELREVEFETIIGNIADDRRTVLRRRAAKSAGEQCFGEQFQL